MAGRIRPAGHILATSVLDHGLATFKEQLAKMRQMGLKAGCCLQTACHEKPAVAIAPALLALFWVLFSLAPPYCSCHPLFLTTNSHLHQLLPATNSTTREVRSGAGRAGAAEVSTAEKLFRFRGKVLCHSDLQQNCHGHPGYVHVFTVPKLWSHDCRWGPACVHIGWCWEPCQEPNLNQLRVGRHCLFGARRVGGAKNSPVRGQEG